MVHDPGWGKRLKSRTPLKCCYIFSDLCRYFTDHLLMGSAVLSGRVLDSRPKGRGVTALWFLRRTHLPSIVLVRPRKIRPYITEILLMGRKESNQTNK